MEEENNGSGPSAAATTASSDSQYNNLAAASNNNHSRNRNNNRNNHLGSDETGRTNNSAAGGSSSSSYNIPAAAGSRTSSRKGSSSSNSSNNHSNGRENSNSGSSSSSSREFVFVVHFNGDQHRVKLAGHNTINDLKARLADKTAVAACRQVLGGWPTHSKKDAQIGTSTLRSLSLARETDLNLTDLSSEGFMVPAANELDVVGRLNSTFTLNILLEPEGRCKCESIKVTFLVQTVLR